MNSQEFTNVGGRPAFRKFLRRGHSPEFRAEAAGLRALAATGTVSTPAVLSVSDSDITTARIVTGEPGVSAWETLGTQLASLHRLKQPCFGFPADNFCGRTPQPNPQCDNGHEFYAVHRLQYQGDLARGAGLLDAQASRQLDSLCRKLPELVPDQGPALIHGDLWNGNVLFDEAGAPILTDPACYWGWPEAELAMCALFGGFPAAFFDSWEASAAPEPRWRDRLPIYQLYHVLNHLNLFGGGYHGQAVAILRAFA